MNDIKFTLLVNCNESKYPLQKLGIRMIFIIIFFAMKSLCDAVRKIRYPKSYKIKVTSLSDIIILND